MVLNIIFGIVFRINYILIEKRKKGQWKFKFNIFLLLALYYILFNYDWIASHILDCDLLLANFYHSHFIIRIYTEFFIKGWGGSGVVLLIPGFVAQFLLIYMFLGGFHKKEVENKNTDAQSEYEILG
ncbi:hypothetical protein RBH29_17335 [Herbivorax sp. ANBcel31]|uniref:hypothetical protein n=1 Tax=Herbivorax sp. ANBcel31 TaxID=3069754 RepID=UPI0027AE81C7|nr:hypothetical protein [Herbivorax sp. ANBcel31]MDQ2088189.1 hypothetical protein [Herbivorax sp. ANBcel31]